MKSFIIFLFEVKILVVFSSELSVLRWNQSIDDFVVIINKTDAEEIQGRKNITAQSRLLEIHNFQKAPVRIAYFEEDPIMVTLDNGTKIGGIIGQIWSELSEYLNFTQLLIKSETDIFSKLLPDRKLAGIISLFINNSADIIPNAMFSKTGRDFASNTSPYWEDSVSIYIRPEYKSNESWLLEIFSLDVLLFIILMMMIFSISALILEKLNETNSEKSIYSIQDHLFCTFAAFCSQGSSEEHGEQYKLFEFSRRIFTWFLLLTVSSNLISMMTNTELEPPFRDLQSLIYQTNYKILIHEGSLTERKFDTIYNRIIKSKNSKSSNIDSRIILTNSTEEMFERFCSDEASKYAIIESLSKRYSDKMKMYNLEPTGFAIEKSWSSGIVKGNFKYGRAFDVGIIRLREVGILSKLRAYLSSTKYDVSDSKPIAIEFKHVSVLFIILLLGSIISVLICAGENIYYCWQRRKKQVKTKQLKKTRFSMQRKNKALKKSNIVCISDIKKLK